MKIRTLFSLAACAGLLGTTLAAQGAVMRPAPPQEPNPLAVIKKVMQRFDRLENALKRVTEALKKSEQMNQAQEARLRQLEQVAKGAPHQAGPAAPKVVAQPKVFGQAPQAPRAFVQAAPAPKVAPQAPPAQAQPPAMMFLHKSEPPKGEAERRVMIQRAPGQMELGTVVPQRIVELKRKAEELKGRVEARVQVESQAGPPAERPMARAWIRNHVRENLGKAFRARIQRQAPQTFRGPGPAARPQAGAEAGRVLFQRVAAQLKNMPPAARQAFFQELAKLRQHLLGPQGRGQAGPPAHAQRPPQRGGRHRI